MISMRGDDETIRDDAVGCGELEGESQARVSGHQAMNAIRFTTVARES